MLSENQIEFIANTMENWYDFDMKIIKCIDFWVANFQQEEFPQSKPLLITGPPGSGKSSLISRWLMYHQEYSSKDNNLVITECPGLCDDPTYAQSLFNILERLKQEYDLKFKLSVKEERLRTVFCKLFESTHPLPTPKRNRKCVVIVIDGVDMYRLSNGREDTAEWLPIVLSDAIRVIYSCDEGSEAYSSLAPYCKVIRMKELKKKYRFKLINMLIAKFPDMGKSGNLEQLQMFIRDSPLPGNYLFLKLLSTWALSSFPDTPRFEIPDFSEINGLEYLFKYAIRFYSSCCGHKIKKVFSVIKISKFSLSKEEISLSSGVNLRLTNKILSIFDCCLLKKEDFYCFSNAFFKKCVDIEDIEQVSRNISSAIEEINKNDRILELLHALKISKDWKKLKEKLREIKVFVSLFNSRFKVEICHLWAELEKNSIDPVEEYNRSIEDFLHNGPLLKPEDVVNLMVNFFCFFDEYGLIECPKSVNFRNYPLTNKESLEQVKIFDEVLKVKGIYREEPDGPLYDYEKEIMTGTNRDEIREIIMKMNLDNSKKNREESYHYKRWLWIQFPMITLNPCVNVSAFLSLLKSPAGIPYDQEQEIFETLKKIISPSEVLTKSVSRPHSVKPLLSRGNTIKFIRSAVGIKRRTSGQDVSQIIEESLLKHSFTNQTLTSAIDQKPETYKINFSLRDTGINTVLLKLNNQLVKFSEVEIKKKFKETQKLQQEYNKLKQTQSLKMKEIENIEVQIKMLKAKYLEKEEVLQKFNELQFQSNKSLEKQVLVQTEVEYIEKILDSCVKNPPFINEWNNDMLKAIKSCEEFTKAEEEFIAQYEKDTFEYSNKYNELKAAVNENRTAGNSTLSKLSEKYSMNAHINKIVVNNFNRRKVVLVTPENKYSASYMKNKLISRKGKIDQVKHAKSVLGTKKHKFEILMKQIAKISNEPDSLDVKGIIYKFQAHFDLLRKKEELNSSLADLNIEKNHLQEKLNYLQSLKTKPQNEEEQPKNMVNLINRLEVAAKSIEKIKGKVEDQDVKIANIKELLFQISKKVGFSDMNDINKGNAKEFVRKLIRNLNEYGKAEPHQPKPKLSKMRTKLLEAVIGVDTLI